MIDLNEIRAAMTALHEKERNGLEAFAAAVQRCQQHGLLQGTAPTLPAPFGVVPSGRPVPPPVVANGRHPNALGRRLDAWAQTRAITFTGQDAVEALADKSHSVDQVLKAIQNALSRGTVLKVQRGVYVAAQSGVVGVVNGAGADSPSQISNLKSAPAQAPAPAPGLSPAPKAAPKAKLPASRPDFRAMGAPAANGEFVPPRQRPSAQVQAIRLIAREWGKRQWLANEMLAALNDRFPELMNGTGKDSDARFRLMDLRDSGELKSIGTGAARYFTATASLKDPMEAQAAKAGSGGINVPRDADVSVAD